MAFGASSSSGSAVSTVSYGRSSWYSSHCTLLSVCCTGNCPIFQLVHAHEKSNWFLRFVLFEHETLRQNFELLCIYAGRFSNFIPITFLTGFYVSQVVARWWSEFMTLPWPEKIAYRLVSFIPGNVCNFHTFVAKTDEFHTTDPMQIKIYPHDSQDPFQKNLRRTVMRYTNLSTMLVYRYISRTVQKRFPGRYHYLYWDCEIYMRKCLS